MTIGRRAISTIGAGDDVIHVAFILRDGDSPLSTSGIYEVIAPTVFAGEFTSVGTAVSFPNLPLAGGSELL